MFENHEGPSDSRDVSRQDLTQQFNRAVSFIGKKWLKERHEWWYGNHDENGPHHAATPPAVIKAYHAGLMLESDREEYPSIEQFGALPKEEQTNSYPEDLAEDVINDVKQATREVRILYELGENLQALNGAEIVDENWDKEDKSLQEEYQEHLQNEDEALQRLFELRIGALYARQGETVQFVDEGGENSEQTPDIRLPSQTPAAYIECKRCDEDHPQEDKRRELLDELFGYAAAQVDEDTIVYFEFKEETDAEDFDRCLDQKDRIASNIKTNEQIDVPGGIAYKIEIPETLQDYTIPDRVNEQTALEVLFVEDFVSTLVKQRVDKTIDYQDIYTYEILGEYWYQSGQIQINSPIWVGANYSPTNKSYSSRVINQLSAARGKFESSSPNILHISVPFWHELTRDQVDEIRGSFKGALNVSGTINRIFTSWSGTVHDGSDLLLVRQVDPLPHIDPEGEFDDEFYSFDIDFESLIEDLGGGSGEEATKS